MKIIIIDYSTGEVHIHELPLSYQADPASFVIKQFSEPGTPFKESSCDFMVVDMSKNEGRLPLYIH